ncbi:MAG: alpha-amylase family glycosyl hydrolase [Planctomycetota bacterium]
MASNPFATQPKADDVFYHVMPIAWRDGADSDAIDPNRFGDLPGIRDGLGYLDDLGITAIWMNPVFPSPAYHGYQHGPADQINPWFGTEQDLIDLTSAAHDLGIEIYLDFVVYGISHNSPWYQNASGNPSSQYDDWLAFTNFQNSQYQGYTFPTWTGATVGFIHWDLRTPEATQLNVDWALKWLDPNGDGDPSDGIDGYRLDHVWVDYGNGPDGWGYNLDDFWTTWHDALRALNPGVFTFAEQHNWGSHGAEFLPEFDAAMTKPFEFAARDALRDQNAAPLYGQMDATISAYTGASDQGTFVAIIGDHDVDRLASAIGADNPFTIGRSEAAAAVLMLQPFPPIIYYGDEIAMTGTKADYGSDANDIPMREPFKWNAVESAPMSRYHRLNGQAFANQFSGNNDGRSVEEQLNSGPLQAHKDLITHRHANVALRRGTYHAIDAASGAVWAFLRSYEQGDAPIADETQTIAVAINLTGSTLTTSLDVSDFHNGSSTLAAVDLATGASLPSITPQNASAYEVTIPPYGYALIETDLDRPAAPPITIDGQLDAEYTEITTGPGGSIWAAVDGDTLYLATEPASSGRDRFIVVADEPGGLAPAMWGKSGFVASHDAYVGNEADNNWTGWFDAIGPVGPVSAQYLEAGLDLADQFGTVPDTVHVAALGFFTADGDTLDPTMQVPAGNGDLNVDAGEFIEIDLAALAGPTPCNIADIALPYEIVDLSDVDAFVNAFAAGEPLADLVAPIGFIDLSDIDAFIAAFLAGCP